VMLLRRFDASPDIVFLRELEKWSYARRSFWTFRQCIHPDLIVGDWPRAVSWHLQNFYYELIEGKRPKLVISSPPQHGKSLAVTDFMAWIMGLNPDLKVIFASYSDTLGERATIEADACRCHRAAPHRDRLSYCGRDPPSAGRPRRAAGAARLRAGRGGGGGRGQASGGVEHVV
jgi:hypothetical protein